MYIEAIEIGIIGYQAGNPSAFFAEARGLGLSNLSIVVELPGGQGQRSLNYGDDEYKYFYDNSDLRQYPDGDYSVIAKGSDGFSERFTAKLGGTLPDVPAKIDFNRTTGTSLLVSAPSGKPPAGTELELIVRLSDPAVNGFKPVKRVLLVAGRPANQIAGLRPNLDYELTLVSRTIVAGGRNGKMTASKSFAGGSWLTSGLDAAALPRH
jgi:hypothetical protein